MPFDPDAYLKRKHQPTAFNPDDYLRAKNTTPAAEPPAPEQESTLRQVGRIGSEAVVPGTGQLRALATAAGDVLGAGSAQSQLDEGNAAILEDMRKRGVAPEVIAKVERGFIKNVPGAGTDFAVRLAQESDDEVQWLKEAETTHPWLATGAQVGGMLLPWNRASGVVKGPATATRAGRAALGAVDAARAGFVTSSARGADLGEAGKMALASAPVGAAGGAIGAGGMVKSTVTGAGLGAAGERLSHLAAGSDAGPGETLDIGGIQVPVSMLKAAGLGAGLGAAGAVAGKGREMIRDPRTQRGRNVRAAEEAGAEVTMGGIKGPRIDQYAEGDFGIGQAALKAADDVMPIIEGKRKGFNSAFGLTEEQLLAQSADKRIDSTPLLKKVNEAIKDQRLSDGTPVPADDLAQLQQFRARIADEMDLGGRPAWAPKDLTVEDLVKLRRQADELGNVGRVAGKDDVAYRGIARLLREELIPQADPELAALFRRHHENLTKLENAHGALVLRQDTALPETQSLRERAQGRIAAFGMSDLKGPAREAAIRDAMADVPEIRQPIMDARAVRAREELGARTNQVGWTAGPVQAAKGLLTGKGDAAMVRADPILEALQMSSAGPAVLFEARRRDWEQKRRRVETLRGRTGGNRP